MAKIKLEYALLATGFAGFMLGRVYSYGHIKWKIHKTMDIQGLDNELQIASCTFNTANCACTAQLTICSLL